MMEEKNQAPQILKKHKKIITTSMRFQELNFTEIRQDEDKSKGTNGCLTSRENKNDHCFNKQNMQAKKPIPNIANIQIFHLPRLKHTPTLKMKEEEQIRMAQSLIQPNSNNQEIQPLSLTKQKKTSQLQETILKLKKTPRYSLSLKSQEEKQSFISRLQIIRQSGTKLEKSTNFILNKAKNASNFIGKKYRGLSRNSNTILTGVEDYHLEEEGQRKYKYQVREMWMKYDR